jgi:hypothetical protein
MAIDTLYIDKTVLISRLRMTGTSDTDTLTTIDQAIADVRQEFFRRLTLERALEIQALPSVENPTTVDGNYRSVAEVTEFYWVLSKLLCILPTMFIETAHAIQNSFKDVPITRDSRFIAQMLDCINNSIEVNLGMLEIPADRNTGSPRSFSTRGTPVILSTTFPGRPSFRMY